MAEKILLVAGHGAGDPGAVANGRNEAAENRKVVQALHEKLRGKIDVTLYNTAKDLYRTNDHSQYQGYTVIEVHFNSASAQATGVEVLIKDGFEPDALDQNLLNVGAKYWRNRGFKYRSDLKNMNVFASLGVNYRLLEVCFISNAEDMRVFDTQFDAYTTDLANVIQAYAGSSPSTTTPTEPPKQPESSQTVTIRVGANVTLSENARTYVTGENIPNWVKGNDYTIQEVDGNKVLLREIYSWVAVQDIKGASGANTTAPYTNYQVGDRVRFSSCYASSMDPIEKHISASNMVRDTGTITKIIAEARNPYLLDNGLCWVNVGDIREKLN